MSFRNNAYATVWEIKDGKTAGLPGRIRITTSKKKQALQNGRWVDVPGQYETDFSGWVFLSRACGEKAKTLKQRDRIKLTSVDVTVTKSKDDPNKYDTFFRCFDFEPQESINGTATQQTQPQTQASSFVDVPDTDMEELPFS